MFAFLNYSKSSLKNFCIYSLVFLFLNTFFACTSKNKDNTKNTKANPKDLALQYLSQNHLDEAQAAFQQAIKMDPDDISSYIGLTRLNILQKNYDDAEKVAKDGLKTKPDNVDLQLLLADIYTLKNDKQKAAGVLNEVIAKNPKNTIAYYTLSELDSANIELSKSYLLKVQNLVPANIVPRMKLADIFVKQGKTDSARFYLQSIRKIAPAFTDAAQKFYDKAVSALEANNSASALINLQQFNELMRISPEYASGEDEIEIPKMVAGFFDFDTNIPVSAFDSASNPHANSNNSTTPTITFHALAGIQGGTSGTALNAENAVMAIADYDAQGNMYIYSSYLANDQSNSGSYLSVNQGGTFKECSVSGGIEHNGRDLDAAFADYDNDGYQDLFVATTNGILVYKNKGDGTFEKVTDNIGFNKATDVTKILVADLDQDGDLDLYAASKTGNLFFRNNGDGTFTENATAMHLNTPSGIDMDFGDWDDDGDLDIAELASDGSVHLLNNNRHSNFSDISAQVGLANPKFNGSAIALGDYNNDGTLDIFVAGSGGKCLMLTNEGGQFVEDEKNSDQLSSWLMGVKVYNVLFFDYDNDGHEDLLVAGVNRDVTKRGLKLFHNEGAGGFSDASSILPESPLQASRIAVGDFNFDGDRDIFTDGPSAVQLLRNDGGNSNNYIQVQLTGLSFGSSKNNRLGIGAQVELKSGDLYQVKTVKGPLVEFGVGSRTSVDALRIIWPNGVPQTIIDPTRKQRALEQAELKGSCPFLFTWNGKEFVFLKDILWRSALGMPVAIHGKDTTFAYSQPSKEYLLIPGDKLQSRNGLYTVKISEELWEAVFFDKAQLFAIDHPDSVDAYVDEKFVAPPYPGKKIHLVAQPKLPLSATDGEGNDVLPKLEKYDFQYVSNFSLGKFQGVAKEHDLILDLGKDINSDSLLLYMRGWIFPSDASINTELTQTDKYQPKAPSLQVINKEGKWQTVIKDIGYPMGRDKMVIVNLAHKFLTAHDRRIRIRTTMQIYWDQIFYSTANVKAPVNTYDLKMVNAHLDFRGYSGSYHKGGPFGPQWFNYYDVSKGQKWRDLTGKYTRFGDVLPLLEKADDQYIICDGGDEVTIDFDANHLPALQKGWKRDFIVYSEGWVKDGDLNTAYGQTVAPLPFHDMPSYPYGKKTHYPTDKAHQEYQEKYNTRKVSTDAFRNAVRLGTFASEKN